MFFGLVWRIKSSILGMLSTMHLWCAIKCTALQVGPLWCHKACSYLFQASENTPKLGFVPAVRVFARGCKHDGAKHGHTFSRTKGNLALKCQFCIFLFFFRANRECEIKYSTGQSHMMLKDHPTLQLHKFHHMHPFADSTICIPSPIPPYASLPVILNKSM